MQFSVPTEPAHTQKNELKENLYGEQENRARCRKGELNVSDTNNEIKKKEMVHFMWTTHHRC